MHHTQLPATRALDSPIKRPSHPKAEEPRDEEPFLTTPSPYLSPEESPVKKKRVPYATIDLDEIYDHPQSQHSMSLHEELLHYINQEWASLVKEVS